MNAVYKRSFPLQLHISTWVILLVFVVGATITLVSYKRTTQLLENVSRDLFIRIARETSTEFDQLFSPGEQSTKLLALQRVTQATNLQQRLQSIDFMKIALDESPEVTSFGVYYGNGDAFLVRRFSGTTDRILFSAPDNAFFMVQSIEHENANVGQNIYFDKNLQLIRSESHPEYGLKKFDPRQLDSYKQAIVSKQLIRTEPYTFLSDGTIGVAIAQRSMIKGVVVSASIRLNSLAEVLQREKISKGTQLALVEFDGRVLVNENMDHIFSSNANEKLTRYQLSEFGNQALAGLANKLIPNGQMPDSKKGELLETNLSIGDDKWFAGLIRLDLQSDRDMYLAIAIPEMDMINEANLIRRDNLLSTLLILLLTTPLALLLAHAISRPLQRLGNEAEAVQRFDFSNTDPSRSIITEVDQLSVTIDGMRKTIRQFLQINQAVAAEEDFDVLLLKLLSETANAIDAQGGVLFLTNAKCDRFRLAAGMMKHEVQLFKSGNEIEFDRLPNLIAKCIATQEAQTGQLLESELTAFDLPNVTVAPTEQWALALPLLNRKRQLVGVLLFFTTQPADTAKLSFVAALSASSAVSLETRELIKSQKELFESFIRMIASAIDAKSPYTGGHCARVPELTKMLAQAACDAKEGPYTDFMLAPDDWETVHIAAWLHDCGKVTTPDFVVDKATKLETIYDRIHEIRLRFELLKKSAETNYWKSIAQGGNELELLKMLEAECATLDDDFAFVAQCNQGGEYLSAENQQRLHEIGQRTWQRTLDDRLGLAHETLKLLEEIPISNLPCQEPLLSDRPEHRIARPESQRFDSDNPWGFRMSVPELLYNRGELHNLCVSRGTLTEEDRYKINEHIVQTIIMLSRLPFPKHLQDVPEIAGGHHEKMDGSGYPKRLTREQMSPVARMMAIADIFEALTAIDRPYKKGKTLSEAIKIMANMKQDQHIDGELFELFLRSGIYLEYARRYMPEELIDAVNIDDLLS